MKRANIKTVAVIGQGYVGRELSLAVTDAGYKVIGIDNDLGRIKEITEYSTSDNLDYLHTCDIVAICLPTNHDYYRPLLVEIQRISDFMSPGSLLVVESTVGIGFNATLRSAISENILMAYSPERIDPGNSLFNINNTAKLLSAFDDKSYEAAHAFYSSFVEKIVKTSVQEAEATKLLENAFRLINISFINEVAVTLNKLGINANNVIDAASTKPYGYMPFRPGIGAGGHCIPVDPIFLLQAAYGQGLDADMLSTAIDSNSSIIYQYAEIIREKLGGLKGRKIMVVGLSYKPNTNDTRNSQAIKLLDTLRFAGADAIWHDEIVGTYRDDVSCLLTDPCDLAIIVHRHDGVNTDNLNARHIIDCERL